MKMEIIIWGNAVETIPLDLDTCKNVEERQAMLENLGAWLKDKYQKPISITDNWEISVNVESRMRYLTTKEIDEYEFKPW